jgi:hypothetical protein
MVESGLARGNWFAVTLTALAGYNAGAVWLAQISGYPLWIHVGANEFPQFYAAWSKGAWLLIFAPLVLAMVGACALLVLRQPGFPAWAAWTGAALAFALVALSLIWWSPAAAQIAGPDGGLNRAVYLQFVETHWLRVGMVTVFAILACWNLAIGLSAGQRGGLTASQWVLIGTSATAFYGLGSIWPVQLLCYRIWPYVGRNEFYGYHVAWWHSIWTVIFIPAGVAFAGAVAMWWLRPAGVGEGAVKAGLTIQLLLYLLTALWWAPLMARLATRQQGLLLHNYQLLMTTHWARVAIVTAYAVAVFWMLLDAGASRMPVGQGSAS